MLRQLDTSTELREPLAYGLAALQPQHHSGFEGPALLSDATLTAHCSAGRELKTFLLADILNFLL